MMYEYLETNDTVEQLIDKYDFVACKLRNSRIKSMDLAIREVLFSFRDFLPIYLTNGPLSDVKGQFVIIIPKDKNLDIDSFNSIGYCNEFYNIDFNKKGDFVWKKHRFSLKKLLIQDENDYINEGSDKRPFKIKTKNGEIKDLIGYRGDGSETGRRALPVEDCRVLINLSMPEKNKVVLDPFAGGGGIVYQAKKQGLTVFSNDIDETVAPGLESYGSKHTIGDARDLCFETPIDCIATEVPFSANVTDVVCESLKNVSSYLNENGMATIMCADYQADKIKQAMKSAKMKLCSENDIDRKGTSVKILNFTNSYQQFCEIQKLNKTLASICYKGKSGTNEKEFC